MYPIIAISTRPRVGSMWAYNVARLLVQKAGLNVVPDSVPKSDDEMLAAAEACLKRSAANERCVIKVHIPLDAHPNLKVIYIKRNLRDQIFSTCRFLNRPLTEQAAKEMAAYMMGMDLHYEPWPSSKILRISFDLLESESIALIRRISNFIGVPSIGSEDIQEIDFKLSKNRLRKKISRMDELAFSETQDDNKNSISKIKGPSGIVRAYDDSTGFQSGHVSDYHSGDWEKYWTDQQKQMVDNAIQIVKENIDKVNGQPDN